MTDGRRFLTAQPTRAMEEYDPSMYSLLPRSWKCGWQGKAMIERRYGIEHDDGGVRKAKGCSSGPSVQEFLRGDEGVGKLGIGLVTTNMVDRKSNLH